MNLFCLTLFFYKSCSFLFSLFYWYSFCAIERKPPPIFYFGYLWINHNGLISFCFENIFLFSFLLNPSAKKKGPKTTKIIKIESAENALPNEYRGVSFWPSCFGTPVSLLGPRPLLSKTRKIKWKSDISFNDF